MEASFSIFHICTALTQHPPTQHPQPHQPGGTGSAKMHEGAPVHSHHNPINHLLRAPAAMRWYGMDRGGQGAPSTSKISSKTSKTMSALPAIGCNWAPDLPHTHPQGVHRDSLGSFMLLAGQQVGETLMLCTFFEHAASTTVLYVL